MPGLVLAIMPSPVSTLPCGPTVHRSPVFAWNATTWKMVALPGEPGAVSYLGGMTTDRCLQFLATCWLSGGAQGRRPSPPAQGSRLETIAGALPTDPYTRSGSSRHALPAAVCHIANSRSALELSLIHI